MSKSGILQFLYILWFGVVTSVMVYMIVGLLYQMISSNMFDGINALLILRLCWLFFIIKTVYLSFNQRYHYRQGNYDKLIAHWNEHHLSQLSNTSYITTNILPIVFIAYGLAFCVLNGITLTLEFFEILPDKTTIIPDIFFGCESVYVQALILVMGSMVGIIFSVCTILFPMLCLFISAAMWQATKDLQAKSDLSLNSWIKFAFREYRKFEDILDIFNDIYSNQLVVMIGMSVPMLIAELFIIVVDKNVSDMARITVAWWLSCEVLNMISCFIAASISAQAGDLETLVSSKISNHIWNSYKEDIEDNCTLCDGETKSYGYDVGLEQAKCLQQLLKRDALAMSVGKFFVIDHGSALSIGSVIISFFILLVQSNQSQSQGSLTGKQTPGNLTNLI